MTSTAARAACPACVAAALVLADASRARAQVAPPAPTTLAVGDWQIAPVAQVRVRGEYRRDLDERDQGTLVERARLGLEGRDGPVAARVVLQDARDLSLAAGPDPVGGPLSASYAGAYEAWVEGHTGPGGESFVRLGRQAVVWGEGRLLGENDWSAAGRSLDALRGRLVLGDVDLELLAAALMDPSTPDSLHSYGELGGLLAAWHLDPLLAFEAYGLGRFAHDDPAASFGASVRGETYTGAVRAHGNGRGWTWGAEGAYQGGRADDLARDRSAFAAAGHVARKLENVIAQPSLELDGSYASGDHGTGTFGGFDPLLPDVHRWHGAADLVSWSNEADVGATLGAAPWRDGAVTLGYRYLRLAQAQGAWTSGYGVTLGAAAGNTKGDLGHEIDATARWSPWAPLDLALGYSFLALGDGARTVLGGPVGAGVLREASVLHFAYAGVSVVLP